MAYQAVRVAGAKYHLKAMSLDGFKALHLCIFQNTSALLQGCEAVPVEK